MKTSAVVIEDSVSPAGCRLTTLEVTLPRFLLAEFNTHRMLSRNSASSRAIPIAKRLKEVEDHPFVPPAFGTNQKGMQAGPPLEGSAHEQATILWRNAASEMCEYAARLAERGVHKQLVNRLLEPFLWHTIVVSATEWDNFFHLRCHQDAQPEFQHVAACMRDALAGSTPRERTLHLPYVSDEERTALPEGAAMPPLTAEERRWLGIAAARCARVSTLTHDGRRDLGADEGLHARLLGKGHISPLEHPAMAQRTPRALGNFYGWTQYRKMITGEHDILALLDQAGAA